MVQSPFACRLNLSRIPHQPLLEMAGRVVIKDVPAYPVVAGNPARLSMLTITGSDSGQWCDESRHRYRPHRPGKETGELNRSDRIN